MTIPENHIAKIKKIAAWLDVDEIIEDVSNNIDWELFRYKYGQYTLNELNAMRWPPMAGD